MLEVCEKVIAGFSSSYAGITLSMPSSSFFCLNYLRASILVVLSFVILNFGFLVEFDSISSWSWKLIWVCLCFLVSFVYSDSSISSNFDDDMFISTDFIEFFFLKKLEFAVIITGFLAPCVILFKSFSSRLCRLFSLTDSVISLKDSLVDSIVLYFWF